MNIKFEDYKDLETVAIQLDDVLKSSFNSW